MITYFVWKGLIEEVLYFSTNFEKMFAYALSSFLSIVTIPLDIITLPFQLIGIIIFLITNRKGK